MTAADGSTRSVKAASYDRDGTDYVFVDGRGRECARVPVARVQEIEAPEE